MSSKLVEALKRGREIQLIVKGRVTGKETSWPVWFVLKDMQILLVPVNGTMTQWYKNIVKYPQVRITVAGNSFDGKAQPIKDNREISEVVELFRTKYGASDIKRYYPRLDAASKLSLG